MKKYIEFYQKNSQLLLPAITLLFLFLLAAIIAPNFIKLGNILNILKQSSYTGIIALGMALIIISGGIDLSVGSMASLIGGITIITLNQFPGDSYTGIVIAFFVCILSGAVFGSFNGITVVKAKIEPFIATIGTFSLYRSLSIYLGGAGEFRSENHLFPNLSRLGGSIPLPIWLFILLAVFTHILFSKTRLGKYIIAVGYNKEVARYSAIPVSKVSIIPYIITGVFVGFATFLWASRLNSVNSSNFGLGYELDAIAAVVIGGTAMSGGRGSIIGTAIGVLTLGVINNILVIIGISPYLQGTVKGLVIILAVFSQYQSKK